jgi:hypothetical protein
LLFSIVQSFNLSIAHFVMIIQLLIALNYWRVMILSIFILIRSDQINSDKYNNNNNKNHDIEIAWPFQKSLMWVQSNLKTLSLCDLTDWQIDRWTDWQPRIFSKLFRSQNWYFVEYQYIWAINIVICISFHFISIPLNSIPTSTTFDDILPTQQTFRLNHHSKAPIGWVLRFFEFFDENDQSPNSDSNSKILPFWLLTEIHLGSKGFDLNWTISPFELSGR